MQKHSSHDQEVTRQRYTTEYEMWKWSSILSIDYIHLCTASGNSVWKNITLRVVGYEVRTPSSLSETQPHNLREEFYSRH